MTFFCLADLQSMGSYYQRADGQWHSYDTGLSYSNESTARYYSSVQQQYNAAQTAAWQAQASSSYQSSYQTDTYADYGEDEEDDDDDDEEEESNEGTPAVYPAASSSSFSLPTYLPSFHPSFKPSLLLPPALNTLESSCGPFASCLRHLEAIFASCRPTWWPFSPFHWIICFTLATFLFVCSCPTFRPLVLLLICIAIGIRIRHICRSPNTPVVDTFPFLQKDSSSSVAEVV